jgi:hypothetical protein
MIGCVLEGKEEDTPLKFPILLFSIERDQSQFYLIGLICLRYRLIWVFRR